MERKGKWLTILGMALGVMVLMSMSALAGSSSTTLPNGAELAVSVDDPETCTEFLVPPDASTIDVDVAGTASVGLGVPRANWVYVIDVSGSTDTGSGTGCAPILQCEQKFVKALNQAVINDGSADEVGVVVYGNSAATADMSPTSGDQMIIAPNADGYVNTVVDSTFSVLGGDGGVGQFTNKIVGFETYCTAALQKALEAVNACSDVPNIVVFVSDGFCDDSGGGGMAAFNQAISDLADYGVVVYTIAAGAGSSCDDHETGFDGTLRMIAEGTGGLCFEREDPGQLPDIIQNLIGSTLESLEIEVDSGGKQPIPNDDISLPLPQPGAVSVDYETTAANLGPADHEMCVTANGSDVTGGTADVTQCETIHLLKLTASPPEETNELGSDNEHTVLATILGDPGQVSGRLVNFAVSGQNASTSGTCSPNTDCTTDASGEVSFTYTVPVEPASLGTDTVGVSTVIAGTDTSVAVTKHWVDTTPPEAECVASVNPHGKNEPRASRQNEDGFYLLGAEDDVWPEEDLEIFVVDTGSGTVFGPFDVSVTIKYTEAPGASPESKKIGSSSGQAGAVTAHIIGNGDAAIYAVDGSGNTSGQVLCYVPPLPK